MAEFVLIEVRLRDDNFSPVKDAAPVRVDWKGLLETFSKTIVSPETKRRTVGMLRGIRADGYIGISRKEDRFVPFYVLSGDRSSKIKWLVSQDPNFSDRIDRVYRVEQATWDGSVEEITPGIPDLVPGMLP